MYKSLLQNLSCIIAEGYAQYIMYCAIYFHKLLDSCSIILYERGNYYKGVLFHMAGNAC